MATDLRTRSTTVSPASIAGRLRATVALLERRGYAVTPARLGELCLGGGIPPEMVLGALPGSGLELECGLVTAAGGRPRAALIRERQDGHATASAPYQADAVRFAVALVRWFPFILTVSLAGSLASGGFRESDDVDLNLVVEDGRRHLAYVAINLFGFVHALRHRGKPVDAHTARPLAPRLMTANLVLQRSDCFPLERQDEDMAYELLASPTVVGAAFQARVVAANPELAGHFPQLAEGIPAAAAEPRPALPRWLFPAFLDLPARILGRAAWRYMQWTRRNRPEALARVAFVRSTMRPYALFDEGSR